jgi:hypothetical protein
MNTPARDAAFEFTATAVSCGRRVLSSADITRQARGEYCLLWLTVRNLATEPRTFGSLSTATDDRNNTYGNDGSAEFPVNPAAQAFLEAIDPGATARGVLVFDVPAGTRLSAVELHDSAFTPGVKINITSR